MANISLIWCSYGSNSSIANCTSKWTKRCFIALTEPSVFSQAAVVFTMWLVTKNKKQKELQLPAWIAGIFGVTPPAIYGFTLQNMKLFIIGCIGGAIGGAYIGFSKVISTSMTGLYFCVNWERSTKNFYEFSKCDYW